MGYERYGLVRVDSSYRSGPGPEAELVTREPKERAEKRMTSRTSSFF